MLLHMARPKGINWEKVKTEYVTGSMSQAELAKKHKTAKSTLQARARAEKWTQQRKDYRARVSAKTMQNSEHAALRRAERLNAIMDSLLEKLEQAVGELDICFATHTVKVKEIEYNCPTASNKPTKETVHEDEQLLQVKTIIDRKGLQQVASALKDLKDVQMLRTALDDEEQRARIAKLRRDAAEDGQGKTADVVVIGLPEEFKV